MKKKIFYSQLFRNTISENDPEYWKKVYAEFLFRIDELQSQNCNCFKCQTDLDTYKKYFEKIKSNRTELFNINKS